MIGDQAVMFGKRSEFLYKVLATGMECFAVRKGNYQRVHDKYGGFTQKLKVKVFQRYKDLIRKPILEHKIETLEQIKRINKFDFGIAQVIDNSPQDEKQLMKELEKYGGDDALGQVKLTHKSGREVINFADVKQLKGVKKL